MYLPLDQRLRLDCLPGGDTLLCPSLSPFLPSYCLENSCNNWSSSGHLGARGNLENGGRHLYGCFGCIQKQRPSLAPCLGWQSRVTRAAQALDDAGKLPGWSCRPLCWGLPVRGRNPPGVLFCSNCCYFLFLRALACSSNAGHVFQWGEVQAQKLWLVTGHIPTFSLHCCLSHA